MSDRDVIVSALGREYPRTMMGFQAADMDAAVLAERLRYKPLRERVRRRLTRWSVQLAGPRDAKAPGVRVYVQATCLVVTRTDPLPCGGRRTWYPLHVRWAGPRHVRVRRNWEEGSRGGA